MQLSLLPGRSQGRRARFANIMMSDAGGMAGASAKSGPRRGFVKPKKGGKQDALPSVSRSCGDRRSRARLVERGEQGRGAQGGEQVGLRLGRLPEGIELGVLELNQALVALEQLGQVGLVRVEELL